MNIFLALTCPSMTLCPSPQESKLPLWALIVTIALGALLVLAAAFITLELCWRLRCRNLQCWDSKSWTCPKGK